MGLFGRKHHDLPGGPSAAVYDGLRSQILELDPVAAGMTPSADLPRVWGALLETAYNEGLATVVALADGTTSLYTTGGGGVIGGGGHSSVVAANRTWLTALDANLEMFVPDPDALLPVAGDSVLRVLTYDGRYAVSGSEDDFGNGRLAASPAFHLAHAVITQLRLITEQR